MQVEECNRIIAEFMGVGCDNIGNTKRGCNWNSGPDDTCDSCTQAVFGDKDYFKYHSSLDALVPVWEKLKILDDLCDFRMWIHSVGYSFEFDTLTDERLPNGEWRPLKKGADGNTLQEAAAIATAKAIKELNNNQ